MKRIIDYYLLEWKNRTDRKPLLLRGARQVGKTHAVRELGKTFLSFIEINLELNESVRNIIERTIDPERVILLLSELLQVNIETESTLLFFDEIQNTPSAITMLRYFYEKYPKLHVIAAGSLLDFAIEQVGMPVGRVSTLYMYPMSFLEYLVALGHLKWAKLIIDYDLKDQFNESVHKELLNMVGQYLAIGGMPEAVKEWVNSHTSRNTKMIHSDLVYSYQQDFGKYAKKHQIKYLNILFQKTVNQLSRKFMYSHIGEYQKRELEPALGLLEKAGLLYKVIKSAGQGIPIGSQADLNDFKVIFFDVGLTQALLKLDLTEWFLNPTAAFINKGEIVEAFVGQEMLAYSDPINKESLFYWKREARASCAEVDYLIQLNDKVIPIEVKSGSSKRIKSLQIFLDSHTGSTYGLRFASDNFFTYKNIVTFPLYSVIKPFLGQNENLCKAIKYLITI